MEVCTYMYVCMSMYTLLALSPPLSLSLSPCWRVHNVSHHHLLTSSPKQAKLAFERLDIKKEFHPFISGPHGATSKRISEETGARINIPPFSLMKNEISIAGDKECVAKAVAEVQKIHEAMVSEMRR